MTLLRQPAAIIVGMGLLCALALALPGRTVTGAFANDLFIFLDGAYRVVEGQVPNRDFHTSLGPLAYYIPAAGLALTDDLGAAMPTGMALVILGFVPFLVHVTGSRLRPQLALPFAASLLLLLALPTNLGDRIDALSFAMFYNRIGWAALALLLVMFLSPARQQTGADAACAAGLVLLQVYLKATYGLVAVCFLVLMLTDRRQWVWAALALALVGLGMAAAELAWHGSLAHLRDLHMTAEVSGARPATALARAALINLPAILLAALFVAVALWRQATFRDLGFFAFCLGAGLMILNQNAHHLGIVSLGAAAVVAAERAMARPHGSSLAAGMPLLLMVFLLPTMLQHAVSLGLHATLAFAGAGEPLGLPQMADIRYLRLWSPHDGGFSKLYLESIEKGGEALAALGAPAARVVVLDFANPFSAGLDLEPPEGDWSWLHWGRNVDAEHHLPGSSLLAGADLVMIPRIGINPAPLTALYGPYLADTRAVVSRTEDWTIYGPRTGGGRP